MNFQIQGTELQVGNFTYRIINEGICIYAARINSVGEYVQNEINEFHYIYNKEGLALWENKEELLNSISEDNFNFGFAKLTTGLNIEVVFYDENECRI